MRGRLMVGQRPLEPLILVRVQAPQQKGDGVEAQRYTGVSSGFKDFVGVAGCGSFGGTHGAGL